MSALGKLKKAVNMIPIFQSGKIRFQEIDNFMQDFLFNYQSMSREVGEFNNDKQTLGDMQLNMEALEAELYGEWNTDRKGEVSKPDTVKENKTAAGLKRCHQESTEDNENKIRKGKKSKKTNPSVHEKSQKLTAGTPVKITHEVIFKKMSPRAEFLKKFKCHLCQKAYASKKALKCHLKEYHKSADFPDDMKEVPDKITCRVCDKPKKLGRDLMNRHLRVIHSMEKPQSNYVLRGWFTIDEISWKPLWCHPEDDDPPARSNTSYQVNRDGQVVIYGFAFDVDKDSSNQNHGDIEDPVEEKDNLVCKRLDFGVEKNAGLTTTDSNGTLENQTSVDKSTEREIDTITFSGNEEYDQIPDIQDVVYIENTQEKVENTAFRNNPIDEFYEEPDEDYEKGAMPPLSVQVFDVSVPGGEIWSSDVHDIDSDYEENDSKEYDDNRRKMKQIRINKRNNIEPVIPIEEVESNKIFIEKFENFMKKKSLNNKSSSMNSTGSKAIGNLFKKEDSFLYFQTKKDPTFNLGRLLNLAGNDFVQLPDPTIVDGWLQSIAAPDGSDTPGHQCECLKSHSNLREFLKETLSETDFGNTAEDWYRKEMAIKKIDQIAMTIKNKSMFRKLNNLETAKREEKQQALEALNPSNIHNETKIVSTWMESDECKKEADECLDIYNKVFRGEKITAKEFTRFGTWAKFSTCIEDRNRRAAYSFTNMEFKMKIPKYFPLQTENDDIVDQFSKIPEDWNSNIPQNEGDLPTCWVIDVKGDNLKGGKKAQIILTRNSAEICDRYRDIKGEVFDDEEDESPFFVNMRKKPLTDLQRTKGSLLDRLGRVTGVSRATVNTLR